MAVHAGAVRDFLAGAAARLGVWIAGGYAEPGAERPRNACVVVSPAGDEVARYHKIHPFTLAGEPDHYEAGDRAVTVDVEGVRVTPFVCYDLRFPELFRATAEGTDLFLVIANWPEVRGHAWRVLLRARAIDGMAFTLGVNRVGVAEGRVHRGDSALVDPIGHVVAERAHRPGVVLGEVDPAEVRRARERLSFLADRRPEVYRRLGPEAGE
jgi:predicted amidohydrolase